MNWYYSINSERFGPVDQATFDQLVARGEVTLDTLVWRDGMENWATYAAVHSAPHPSVQPVIPNIAALAGPSCSRCGRSFAASDLVQLSGRLLCASCKPFEVQALSEGAPMHSDSERIRKEHIQHEASVKSVGFLYLLGAAGILLILLGMLVGLSAGAGQGAGLMGGIGTVVLLPLAALQLWAGWGLRKLKRPARIASIVVSAIGLLGFPIGTLINGYILYLMLSKKGVMVFSDEYKRVIEETPHIKYRMSAVIWIILGLLLLLIGFGIIATLGARN